MEPNANILITIINPIYNHIWTILQNKAITMNKITK